MISNKITPRAKRTERMQSVISENATLCIHFGERRPLTSRNAAYPTRAASRPGNPEITRITSPRTLPIRVFRYFCREPDEPLFSLVSASFAEEGFVPICFSLILAENYCRKEVDYEGDDKEHHGNPEEGMVVRAPDRHLPHLDTKRSGQGPYRGKDIPDRVGDDGSVPGHHQDRHRLAHRPPDTEDDGSGDP